MQFVFCGKEKKEEDRKLEGKAVDTSFVWCSEFFFSFDKENKLRLVP